MGIPVGVVITLSVLSSLIFILLTCWLIGRRGRCRRTHFSHDITPPERKPEEILAVKSRAPFSSSPPPPPLPRQVWLPSVSYNLDRRNYLSERRPPPYITGGPPTYQHALALHKLRNSIR